MTPSLRSLSRLGLRPSSLLRLGASLLAPARSLTMTNRAISALHGNVVRIIYVSRVYWQGILYQGIKGQSE